MNKEPEFVNGSWTCPPGYAFGKCYGCGHNFYDSKPGKMVNGKRPDFGLCQWCVAEQGDDDD